MGANSIQYYFFNPRLACAILSYCPQLFAEVGLSKVPCLEREKG